MYEGKKQMRSVNEVKGTAESTTFIALMYCNNDPDDNDIGINGGDNEEDEVDGIEDAYHSVCVWMCERGREREISCDHCH